MLRECTRPSRIVIAATGLPSRITIDPQNLPSISAGLYGSPPLGKSIVNAVSGTMVFAGMLSSIALA